MPGWSVARCRLSLLDDHSSAKLASFRLAGGSSSSSSSRSSINGNNQAGKRLVAVQKARLQQTLGFGQRPYGWNSTANFCCFTDRAIT